MLKKINYRLLIICILMPEIIGFLSNFLSNGAMKDYNNLKHPAFSPPGWVFIIVWIILYLLMGISLYFIIMSNYYPLDMKKAALLFFSAQLFFNFLWSIVFFKYELRFNAFLLTLVIIGLTVMTIMAFIQINKLSGLILIPYLLWLIYASYLNYFTWFLNR